MREEGVGIGSPRVCAGRSSRDGARELNRRNTGNWSRAPVHLPKPRNRPINATGRESSVFVSVSSPIVERL